MNWRTNTYTYTRQRRFFGRQSIFSERHEMLVDIPFDHSLMKDYVLRDPVHRGTQLSKQFSLHVVNTENAEVHNRGMCHIEGGWPKDVNFTDEEAINRYKKKVEREEYWQDNVCEIEKPIMEAIFQNNAVNIFEEYFDNLEPIEFSGTYTACCLDEYRDPEKPNRQITNIYWEPGSNEKLLATYGFPYLYAPIDHVTNNYIWDITDPLKPVGVLKAPVTATCINWNPKDIHILAGALHNGSVCSWDARVGVTPIAVSPLETSHRDVCSTLIWVQSKSNAEFYSGSMDGTIHFWDVRNLSEPFNIYMLDPIKTDEQDIQRAHGCTVLEFEYTIPIRFMTATDKGYIFLGNRKTTKPSEIMVGSFQAMAGPIKSLERNPFYVKYFLVIGDWCTKIWTEDCKTSALTRTVNHSVQLNCGTWNQNRCSLYFTGREDGKVDFWDLLLDQKKPIYSLDIFRSPITALKGNNDGELLAVGTKKGDISLIKLDEALTSSEKNDRQLLSAFFDRELHRVKILDGRMREILLKLKQTKEQETAKKPQDDKVSENDEEIGEEEEEPEDKKTKTEIDMKTVTDFDDEVEDVVTEENENELRMYQIDPFLPSISKQFFKIVNEEKEKRLAKEKSFEKSPFEIQIENPDLSDTRSVGGATVSTGQTILNDESVDYDDYYQYFTKDYGNRVGIFDKDSDSDIDDDNNMGF